MKLKHTGIIENERPLRLFKMKENRSPYTKYLEQPVTIRLDKDSVEYFKALAEESGIPYQTRINLLISERLCSKREKTRFEMGVENHHKRMQSDTAKPRR